MAASLINGEASGGDLARFTAESADTVLALAFGTWYRKTLPHAERAFPGFTLQDCGLWHLIMIIAHPFVRRPQRELPTS